MFWIIGGILYILIFILAWVFIRGANVSKTLEEIEMDNYLQMLALKHKKEEEEREKFNNSRETERCKRNCKDTEKLRKEKRLL